ncbi:hypothetical protein BKA82DRAFT_3935422, partial [Pisolithus tinctorius]
QAWGSGTPCPKKSASTSSTASVGDLPPSQAENGYQSNIGESWSAPRASSGTWDELSSSPQKNGYSKSQDSNPALPLRHIRQRQPVVGQPVGLGLFFPRTIAVRQCLPQRFDHGIGKDGRYSSLSHPVPGAYESSRLPGQNGGFNSVQASSIVENDLILGLRG